MINKIMTADEAVAGVKDGMTIMVGGFLATGSPEVLMDALVRKGVKHLTVIANDGGLDAGQPAGEFGAKTARGVGKLLEHHMVDHIIASHLGVNPKREFKEGYALRVKADGLLADLQVNFIGSSHYLTPLK